MAFYTLNEIATKLKVHVNTVENLIRGRSMSATKVGRQWRVSEDQLTAYLDSRTIKAKKLTPQ